MPNIPNVREPEFEIKDMEIEFPKQLLDYFAKSPRLIYKLHFPAGLWPIDPGILRDQEFLKRVIEDKELQQSYQIVIMER